MDPNGNVIYLHETLNEDTNTSVRLVYDVAIDGEDVYYLGSFHEAYQSEGVSYEPWNDQDGVVCRIDFKGELVWSKTIRSEGYYEGWGDLAFEDGQLHILTPAKFQHGDLLYLNEAKVQVDGAPSAMLISLNAEDGQYLSHQSIQIASNEREYALRGSKIFDASIYLPLSSSFDPASEDLEDKPNSIVFFDLSNAEEISELAIRFSENSSASGRYADDALPTLEVVGEMVSGQWFKDLTAIAGETDNSLEVKDSGKYYFEGVFENGCTNATEQREFEIIQNSLTNDSLILVQFYNDADGDEWINNSGWC